MNQPQFRYNQKTLRYERVRFSIWRAIGSFIAYTGFGFLFFMGLNLAQNFFIETEAEKSLRAENEQLNTYKAVVETHLATSNALLAELKDEESQLRGKLFDNAKDINNNTAEPAESDTYLKASMAEDWSEAYSLIQNRFQSLLAKSKTSNDFYGSRLTVEKSDLPILKGLPSASPVKDLNEQNLVSGFGVRINPYHKGNYHHDGLDIALPKGTEVVATGDGRVVSINNSRVEAGFGNYIEIDHGNGFITRYAHLESIKVNWGQKVTIGQVIGLSGSSGGSVAPHLHYEVLKLGVNLDPIYYLVKGIDAKQHHLLSIKSKTQNQSLD